MSDCQDCEEYIVSHVWRERAGKVRLIGAIGAGERPAKRDRCKGAGPRDASHDREVLGGAPRWTQSPEVPYCLACGRLMVFVGQLNAGGRDLFGFQSTSPTRSFERASPPSSRSTSARSPR